VVVSLSLDNLVVNVGEAGYADPVDDSRGAALAQLLIGGFDVMVELVVADLEKNGHPGVTATHEFALTAIDAGAQNASALGRSLGVTKQAAAKTISALEQLGYVTRVDDAQDARRRMLAVTDRGHDMMALGAHAFDEIRKRLIDRVGASDVDAMERVLSQLTGTSPPA
jgi:DNA-binding MarR family transcriptional regulator